MDYLLLVIADLLLAGDFAINKLYQKRAGTTPRAGLGFNAALGAITAIIFFAANGFKLGMSGFSVVMAALMTTVAVSYSLIGFKLLKEKGMALYTLFLMTGGMTVPYVFGLIFLDEEFSILRTVGLLVIIAGVAVSNLGKEKVKASVLLMCLAVFFLNGIVSIISKVHSIDQSHGAVGSTEFVIWCAIFKFVIAGALWLAVVLYEKRRGALAKSAPDAVRDKKALAMLLCLISISAVFSGVSYALQLVGAANLPATVLYPFITGGSIVCSALAGRFIFGEKLTRNMIVGIALNFAGTLMFL